MRRYDTDNPNRHINAFATPSGAGVSGPGGARVIGTIRASAAMASQKHSQNPSI